MKLLVILTLALVSACGKQQSQELRLAVESLEKVQSATEIGPTYDTYLDLVVEAKSRVNAALSSTEEEGLRSELNSVIDNYQDAAFIWASEMRGETLNAAREPGSSILAEYSLTVDDARNLKDHNQAIKYIWQRAHLTLVKLRQRL